MNVSRRWSRWATSRMRIRPGRRSCAVRLAGTAACPGRPYSLTAGSTWPWRVIQEGHTFHFYLQRTKGYHDSLVQRLLQVEDLQRVDLGIAMCHFELTARELGLTGQWVIQEPKIEKPDALTEYTVSWIGDVPAQTG